MGLYQSNFSFDGAPPALEVVRAEVLRRLGSLADLEGLEVDGQTVVARSMLGPFTHPVVCAVLEELGGQAVDIVNGLPVKADIPDWARAPLSELTWSSRMAIRYRWWAWFFGTAKRH